MPNILEERSPSGPRDRHSPTRVRCSRRLLGIQIELNSTILGLRYRSGYRVGTSASIPETHTAAHILPITLLDEIGSMISFHMEYL